MTDEICIDSLTGRNWLLGFVASRHRAWEKQWQVEMSGFISIVHEAVSESQAERIFSQD